MAYFIFSKNSDNLDGTLYKIAENQTDLDLLNISKFDYKIIEDSQFNFNSIKNGEKYIQKYNGDIITYVDKTYIFSNKESLQKYVNDFKNNIKCFKENNLNHQLFNKWNDYYNQLNSLNLNNITYPLNKSLEQYFNDLNKPSLNPLQLP
jgi:hypothetical protein